MRPASTNNASLPVRRAALIVGLALLAACQRTPDAASPRAPEPAPAHAAADTPGEAPPDDARTPSPAVMPPTSHDADAATPSPTGSLPEPRTPPDVASPQAAATVVETYFALVDAGETADADALWHDAARAAEFRAELAKLGGPHVEVDAPGDVEGAAGSMYVAVPVRFQPTSVPGNARPRNGEVTLRRVNDVPGSTEAQRRWHIDHIDVAMTPK